MTWPLHTLLSHRQEMHRHDNSSSPQHGHPQQPQQLHSPSWGLHTHKLQLCLLTAQRSRAALTPRVLAVRFHAVQADQRGLSP